jgi:hypothetical protein
LPVLFQQVLTFLVAYLELDLDIHSLLLLDIFPQAFHNQILLGNLAVLGILVYQVLLDIQVYQILLDIQVYQVHLDHFVPVFLYGLDQGVLK